MARNKPHIPTVPEEISCGWLTKTLRDSGVLRGDAVVCGLRLESLGGGKGLSGEVLRVHLTYDGDAGDAPATVVAKFPTVDVQNRGLIEMLNVYEREVVFYRDVAHKLPVNTPKYFGSDMDPAKPDPVGAKAKGWIEKMSPRVHLAVTKDVKKFIKPSGRRFALLIEDLGDDVTVHDFTTPPAAEQLAGVFSQLATMHAHFWEADDLHSYRTAAAITDVPVMQRNVFLQRAIHEAAEKYDFIDDGALATMQEAGERFVDDVAHLNRPITLIHSDTRSDNFLFFADGSMRIVDWAMTTAADPGYDIGYSLTACLRPEDGRAAAQELVRSYLEDLSAAGVDYTFDELWGSVEAAARAMLVQQGLSLVFLQEQAYGEGTSIADLWLPRALSILRG